MADKPKTVSLSGETHKKLKMEAVARQVKLKDFLESVIKAGLKVKARKRKGAA